MTKSIKELDEMRQEFVSNVSHEFQSPLSSIQGFQNIANRKDERGRKKSLLTNY